jgi:hypothetical protein
MYVEPAEWLERTRGGMYGYTEKFQDYPNIQLIISPMEFYTHDLVGWRLNIKQKTSASRLYLHFHNKNNFGFRIRLPAKYYYGIDAIFIALARSCKLEGNALTPAFVLSSSEMSVTNVIEKVVVVEEKVVKKQSFEEAMASERERIFKEIGDYRGKRIQLPDNVIDFSEYLREREEIEPSNEVFEDLMKSLG